MEIKKPKILFLITEDWYFWSHRLPLARAIRDAGFQVLIATKVNKYADLLRGEGFKIFSVSLRRRSGNPIHEIWAIIELIKIYRSEQPDLVHHVALKPVLYGSFAARIARVPAIVNAFAGLGFVFIAAGWRATIVRKCVSVILKALLSIKNERVIFQNRDDSSLFLEAGILPRDKVRIIRGSGIDLSIFKQVPEPSGVPLVLMATRMLSDKGVNEFVEAASILKNLGILSRFVLVGESDDENPTSISRNQLNHWKESGVVEWWGQSKNMPEILRNANIVCLPSYREGLPKVLLEAAASGRPIVTTDCPGCKDVVRHRYNGLLVPIRDSKALASALQILIENPELRKKMGSRGREIAIAEFSVEQVINDTLSVYKELLKEKWPRTSLEEV